MRPCVNTPYILCYLYVLASRTYSTKERPFAHIAPAVRQLSGELRKEIQKGENQLLFVVAIFFERRSQMMHSFHVRG